MANNFITMTKLRTIIRLYEDRMGLKTIAVMARTSRNTVKKYIHAWNSLKMSFDEFQSKSDTELHDLFCISDIPSNPNPRRDTLENLLPEISKALGRKGMTTMKQWQKYIKEHPDGYGLTQFRISVQRYRLINNPSMRMEHKAGDKMFVDYTGDKLWIYPHKEVPRQVEVFVAILGCSLLTYVEAVAGQTKEDFISACENAFYFYGGVPQAVVPDNLEAAVTNRAIARAIKQAAFRYTAFLEEIDYTFERGLDRNQVERLAALDFIRDNKNIFITGPIGTGKSYLATALGNKACQDGYKVFYANTAKLMSSLKIAKVKGTILNEFKRIERADLLILDDFAMQSFDSASRGIMMDIMEDRHQKKSTMITSQVPVKDWYNAIGEKTVADAILDRLVHDSLRVELMSD